MKRKHINDIFNYLEPSKEEINSIYSDITNKNKKKYSTSLNIPKMSLAIGCIIILIAFPLLNNNNNQNNISNDNSGNITCNNLSNTPNNNAPSKQEPNIFNGFVVSTYISKESDHYLNANYEEESVVKIINPGTKILLSKYNPIMSSVPGIPFSFNLEENGENSISAKIEVDSGTLNFFDIESGMVLSKGNSTSYKLGETLYWSPITPDKQKNEIQKESIITITAIKEDKKIAVQKIIITMKDNNYYANLENVNNVSE